MTDLISRQAAIDIVAEGLKNVFVEYKDIAEKMLGKLPPAQPEPTLEQIEESTVRCKECKYYKTYYMGFEK